MKKEIYSFFNDTISFSIRKEDTTFVVIVLYELFYFYVFLCTFLH